MSSLGRTIYINSTNQVKVEGLEDLTEVAQTFISNATCKFSLCMSDVVDGLSGALVDKGDGLVGIPAIAHGVTASTIRILGTNNIDGEYALHSSTSVDELVITVSYAAEVITLNARIFGCFSDATAISLVYVTDSDGDYVGTVPSTIDLIADVVYKGFISIVDGVGNVKLLLIEFKAAYAEI